MIKRFFLKSAASLVIIATVFLFSACKQDKIPDLETVSRYSQEDLQALAESSDEQSLIKAWGDPQALNSQRIWAVPLEGGTKYIVAQVDNDQIVSINISKILYVNVASIEHGVTYCIYGWDNYSTDRSFLAFMPTQDCFGNAITCEVGDQFIFEFDGMIMESYPAQIPAPYSALLMGHLSDEEIAQMNPSRQMRLDDVDEFRNQTSFTWDDFAGFEGEDIGSGLFVFKYDLEEGGYLLVSGSSLEEDPQQIVYYHEDGFEDFIYSTEMLSARIEIGQLLGFDECYCLREYYGNGHYGWLFYNRDGMEIARQFGFDLENRPVYYSIDLDGDGYEELICNCTYGADGATRVYIFRNNNGVIEIGSFDEEKMAASLGYDYGLNGAMSHDEYYDEVTNTLIFCYYPENIKCEITINDFVFQEYNENYF